MGVTCMGILAVVIYAGLVIFENKNARKGDEKVGLKKLSL